MKKHLLLLIAAIWYYYIYDENGRRIYRSTGLSNKAKAKAYVLQKYKEGTLFEKKQTEMLFKDFPLRSGSGKLVR